MENFKQIAEDCLAGKLSGTFVLRNGDIIPSKELRRNNNGNMYYPYILHDNTYYTKKGYFFHSENTFKFDIINFIPDMKKEQITIDIPEGMEAVQGIVDGEIRIKFVEKKPTYDEIYKSLYTDDLEIQDQYSSDHNDVSISFHKKVEVLRKLTNIRNYFGKPKGHYGYDIYPTDTSYKIGEVNTSYYFMPVFDKREHAEEAIRILGDELKYLFEPW